MRFVSVPVVGVYYCTSTAEMPAHLQTTAGGRDTLQQLLSPCSLSHMVLSSRKKTPNEGGEKNKSCDMAVLNDPPLQYICTVTKVTRAVRSNSLACLAAVVAAAVVMIYWSHCGKSFTTESPPVIQYTEQSAIRRQFKRATRHDGMRESHLWISRTQHSELTLKRSSSLSGEISIQVLFYVSKSSKYSGVEDFTSQSLELKTFAKIQKYYQARMSAECLLSKCYIVIFKLLGHCY